MSPEAADAPPPRRRLPPAAAAGLARLPIYGLLASVRSVWNVGSMFRTADAAGLAGLYLCGSTATPPRADMEKTALGATLTVPWDYWESAADAVRHLRSRGIAVWALEQAPTSRPYDAVAYPFPACFVVGHEVRGVPADLLALADGVVEIPMAGAKRSLNVAVSFGILAYELRRQAVAGAPAAAAAEPEAS